MRTFDGLYKVIVVDGHFTDLGDLAATSMHYEGLTWSEAVDLVKISFLQGYEVIIWEQQKAGKSNG